jgi:dTDP-glucose pyrophosphorylase/CBS domain-containing protein
VLELSFNPKPDNMSDWKSIVVSSSTPLGEAISKIDTSGLQVALILDKERRLEGILTDGNVRRAILAGKNLEIPVSEVMTPSPTAVPADTAREAMLAILRRTNFHHLPLLDSSDRVVGLVTLDELIGGLDRPNWVVLMAGGLGSRLHPLTEHCPKPLLSVGGKPILESILEQFSGYGFNRIYLSVNYRAEMIQEYFGSGDRWGVSINYLHETECLGTAGALSLLPEIPPEPIIVMNGDLLTHANFDNLLKFHAAQSSVATMAVREYDFQVPYGVVRLEGARIQTIEEKPVHKFFVNAGIYVLSPEALTFLDVGRQLDMTTLFERLIAEGKATAAYPLREYWLDIGQLEEFERAQREWRTRPT